MNFKISSEYISHKLISVDFTDETVNSGTKSLYKLTNIKIEDNFKFRLRVTAEMIINHKNEQRKVGALVTFLVSSKSGNLFGFTPNADTVTLMKILLIDTIVQLGEYSLKKYGVAPSPELANDNGSKLDLLATSLLVSYQN